MDEILKSFAIENTTDINNALHGYVIFLNGRIFITSNRIIFHESQSAAMKRFYNDMRWKFNIYVREYTGTYRNPTSLWNRFKKVNKFEIKRV